MLYGGYEVLAATVSRNKRPTRGWGPAWRPSGYSEMADKYQKTLGAEIVWKINQAPHTGAAIKDAGASNKQARPRRS